MNNEEDFMESFFDATDACKDCGAERIEMSYAELPAEQKTIFKQPDSDLTYYLYCSSCNEYAEITIGGSFLDEFAPVNPIKLIASPSLNADCPCGSGKKYKRCCGKK